MRPEELTLVVAVVVAGNSICCIGDARPMCHKNWGCKARMDGPLLDQALPELEMHALIPRSVWTGARRIGGLRQQLERPTATEEVDPATTPAWTALGHPLCLELAHTRVRLTVHGHAPDMRPQNKPQTTELRTRAVAQALSWTAGPTPKSKGLELARKR